MPTFTDEQEKAIKAQGKTIVSASAGSGKTTVMIEKIIRMIEKGFNVNELLAVTFTKKAASQMKEKLSKSIIATINHPNTTPQQKKRLKQQLSEVPMADISTIHSFCSKLIRKHFYALGIDSAFKVIDSDDADGTEIKNIALDELFEDGYEEKDVNFTHLLSVYWHKKQDANLREILLKTYAKLRDRADYVAYLQTAGDYSKERFDQICQKLYEKTVKKAEYYHNLLDEEFYFFKDKQMAKQMEICEGLMSTLQKIKTAKDYFLASSIEVETVPSNVGGLNAPECKLHKAKLTALKKKVTEFYTQLHQNYTYEEEFKKYMLAGKTAKALSIYLLKFDEKLNEIKKIKSVLDYNDLEHKTLALLQNEEIVAELKQTYTYVFVDEYQDVNPVQEAILSKISDKNVFLVGDVKQSIYGFRGSKSKFFVDKQREFENSDANSLKLTYNFRSADKVLDAVNRQFSLAMQKDTFGIDYAKEAYMQAGGQYSKEDGRVKIHILPEDIKEEKQEQSIRPVYSVKANTKPAQAEENKRAQLICDIIQDEISTTWFDADTQEKKKINYGDIAILSRKKAGEISSIVSAISARGIPVASVAAVNICDFAEIKTLIDILSLIDNAEQDVPLCSALLSPMGDMTANELAKIRLKYKKATTFRQACKQYLRDNKDVADIVAYKLDKFFNYYNQIRTLSAVESAGELLTKILADTRMEAYLLSQDNGESCLKRIYRFIEEASLDQPLNVRDFLMHLRHLNYDITYNESGGENAVKVLTMHAAKGLEYPVVIVDNINFPFKGKSSEEVLIEEKYGLAPYAFDETKLTKKTTLLRALYNEVKHQEEVADELNLYYVALTRSKYALHVISKERPVFNDVIYAHSLADFTDFSVWEEYLAKDSYFTIPRERKTAIVFKPNEALASEIMQEFQRKYPYIGYENLPVKSSATQLINGEPDYKTVAEHTFKKKDYLEEEKDLSSQTNTKIGLAYHAFLERFDFSLLQNASKESLAEIVTGVYTKEEALNEIEDFNLLSKSKLIEILNNPIFKRLTGMQLYKEQQFLVTLPIHETYAQKEGEPEYLKDNTNKEEILFQGAIDLLAVGDKEIFVIDYKYSARDKDSLISHYKNQLSLYRLATAKILKAPKQKIRCFIVNIFKGFQIELPFDN